MESLWHRIKQFSIWRVPNYFIEPSGAFLGERVEAIDRLNNLRSWAGIAIIAGAVVYYTGFSHLGTITNGKDGVKYFTIGNHNPEGNWFLGLLISVVTAMLILPLVSLCLVWWTKRSARRAALVQLRWPYIAIARLVCHLRRRIAVHRARPLPAELRPAHELRHQGAGLGTCGLCLDP